MTPEQQQAIERARQRLQVQQEGTLEERQQAALSAARQRAAETPTGMQRVTGALRDFNTGVLESVGLRGALGGTIGRARGDDPEGVVGAGLRTAGQAATLSLLPTAAAARIPGMGATAAQRSAQQVAAQRAGATGGAEQSLQQIVQTAAQRPGVSAAAELAGGFGAGAAMGAAPDDPTSQALAGLGGGLAGAMTPVAVAGATQGVGRRAMETLAPFTETGGRLRAARQMQARAEDPEAAARAVLQGEPGVSPARRTGEQRLLAQERRILEDRPELDARFRQDLAGASRVARESLVDMGEPYSPEVWRQSVMARVAAPGTEIQPGASDEMLDQAFNSFRPLYDQVRGAPVSPVLPASGGGVVPLRAALRATVQDQSVMASRGDRRRVGAWLDNQLTAVLDRAGPEFTVDAGDLIQFRSAIRAEQRSAARQRDEVARKLLTSAEQRVTQALESQLQPEQAAVLQQADALYGRYKVVEDAVFRAGERELTPQMLSDAIRRSARSPGQFARGSGQDMRQLALAGRDPKDFIGRPEIAARVMRGADDQTKEVIRGGFVDALRQEATTAQIGADGVPEVSGVRLHRLVQDNERTMRALGMPSGDVIRLRRIANELRLIEEASPAAVAQLFEDGPGTLLQLGAALIGAKGGQRIAGQGLGSSLVMAQFASNRMRSMLARFTADKATEIMIRAHSDPELYAALLVGPTSSKRQQDRAADVLSAWLIPATSPLVGQEGEP